MLKETIQKELQQIIENEPDNTSKIVELSTKLSQLDENEVRFSVDAGIIDRLGKELVAKHETAVSELVKNAYDADATKVILSFIDSYNSGGSLRIEDNGLGMTRDQLINGFMRLSSSEKLHYPKSPRFNRKRAGKKGIGRFSAQRLGRNLTIITQTLESEKALKVTINWNDFKADTDLSFITNNISLVEKIKDEGTLLIIENLRDGWTEAQMKRVYRYASEILQPFPLAKRKKDSSTTNDPGFKLNCQEIYEGKKFQIANEKTMFFEHALAEIEGHVDNDGYIYVTFKSNKLNYKEKRTLINPEEPLSVLKNASLKAYYFIYGVGLLSKQVETLIREKAKIQGGIRLYRNSFRVLPYGEQNNDWIGLDASMRRRSLLPPHGNISFFGFIEVNNDFGEQFEELSSREGLLENKALIQLEDFGYKVLTHTVMKIASIRGRKSNPGQEDWKKKPEETIEEAISELKAISSIKEEGSAETHSDEDVENREDSSLTSEKLVTIAEKLEQAQKEQQKKQKDFIKEMNLFRILAALGLTIGEFIHEIKQYQSALQHDIKNIETSTSLENIHHVNQRIKSNLEGLSTYVSYFDEAFSENVQRELKPIELRTVVHALKSTLEADISKRSIEFIEPKFHGYHLYTLPMHKSEWASILFNFYTNARKAINRAKVNGKIFIECGKIYNNVYLEFSDNGDGIQLENRDKIFDAFFTTSAPVGKVVKTHEEMTGTGLGLKIVRDIITSYGGKIFVKEPTKNYSTTIRVELPWEKEGYKHD